jgi:hypothetical protein
MIKNDIKKVLIISVLILFICGSAANSEKINIISNDITIPSEILNIEDKILTRDLIIGDIHVRYWNHVINNVIVKNDYILLHNDVIDSNIIDYDIFWRDVEVPNLGNLDFRPEKYSWKKLVMFSGPEDLTYFYEFIQYQDFPVICWEVRHNDGSTILYNLDGNKIGNGVPAPYKGFSLSGFHEEGYPDPWINWRLNADSWFVKWCDSTTSMSFPTPATISSFISDPDYELFFEIAHGGSSYFQATQTEYYYASDVTTAMQNRNPMRFAFIGSCGGMDSVGPGTWSYEFRKGENVETVVVGYTGMGDCPGWSVALPWQDYMFYAIDVGYTIKDAFDSACSIYPIIAPCVVFTGDPNLKIRIEEEQQEEPIILPKVLITYPSDGDEVNGTIKITGSSHHLDGSVKMVMLKVGDNDWEKANGVDEWSYNWDTTTVPDGEILIQAVSIDTRGLQSAVRYAMVKVKNIPDEKPEPPKISNLECKGKLRWQEIDPEETVYGEFTVENIGDAESLLNWTIVEYPDWGEWNLSPFYGEGLTPEEGIITINVDLTAPDKNGEDYNGSIKIINQNNHSDFGNIPVSITITSTKGVHLLSLLKTLKNLFYNLPIFFIKLNF